MKRILSLILAAVMLVSCLSGMAFGSAAADISGVRTISFAKNGTGGTPYMSGLNVPVGYVFTLDEEMRLLSISIPEFATYSNNTNKGTFKLYEWKGDRNATVAAKPLAERAIVNHVDHDDLVLEIPADLKLTGTLYFEVICLEGTAYTPWNAEGGLIDPIPGVVTDMQAYLGGNPAQPFACDITVCDMENKSPSAFVTFTYDFSKGLTEGADFNQKNQVRVTNGDGYVTFTAEGEDPYIRFSDNYQPTPKTSELAYVVLEYRTTASIPAGEIFTNRRSGAHWGDPGAYVTWDYVADGEWHTVVADASGVWGNHETDELYAFRLDPLISGAKAGDSIDIASIKFFGDGAYARSYAAEREAAIKEDEDKLIEAGSQILDFGAGSAPEGMTCPETVTVYAEEGFTRFVTDETAVISLSTAISAGFDYVKLAYRSEVAVAPLTITACYGDKTAEATVTPESDGYWKEAIVALPTPEGVGEGAVIDRVLITCPEGWVDVAYLGFYDLEEYAEKHSFSRAFNTHQYVLGASDVPVYNVTDTTLGDPFCGGGESYGQKFVADFGVRGIIIPGHATWGADINNNSGYFKLFAWKGDYATTVKSTPLVERELKNLKDGEDLIITFDELAAGEYCFEVKMTTPGGKAYTGFQPKSGSGTPGTVSFRNGSVNSSHIVAGYLTTGVGLKDVGNEYGSEATFTLDFTKHYDSVTEAFGLNNLSSAEITDLCDRGFLQIKATGGDPYFAVSKNPTVTSNLMDHIVIKYRATSKATKGELFAARTDGVSWGAPYEKSNVTFGIVADGEWQIAVIDATSVWGNVYDVLLQNLRFDPLEKTPTAGDTMDVAYIKFFANARAAKACADSEYVTEGDKVTVKAPLRPLDPATVTPALLIEGDRLSVSGGTQMNDATYDYGRDCLTLTIKGSDPGYFLFSEETKVAPYMAIKYRTTTRNVQGEIFAGSVQSTPNGRSDHCRFAYTSDGEWHTAVIDLTQIADYNASTNTVKYLRFDFLHSDSGLSNAASLDIAYIGFFDTMDEAMVYEHTAPEERALLTATFVVNGLPLYTVEFRAGDTSLQEPVVPILPGMVGVWEAYELGNDSITVNAVYTPATETVVPDMPESITPPAGSEETQPPSAETEEPATDAPATETGQTGGTGCGSVLGFGIVPLLLLVGFVLTGKRRDDILATDGSL